MHRLENAGYQQSTLGKIAGGIRKLLIELWQEHGAPKLDQLVPKYVSARPRNTVAHRDEIELLLDKAKPSLRLWLLLCSDLAIRSGTASKLSRANYDKEQRELRFITKGQSKQTLPVTAEIAALLEPLNHASDVPYIWQLRRKEQVSGKAASTYYANTLRAELRALRRSLGLRRIIAHDLRRTTAVAVYEQTQDLRAVQQLLGHIDLGTTLAYLDHDSVKVKRSTLEIIKRPAWRKEQTA